MTQSVCSDAAISLVFLQSAQQDPLSDDTVDQYCCSALQDAQASVQTVLMHVQERLLTDSTLAGLVANSFDSAEHDGTALHPPHANSTNVSEIDGAAVITDGAVASIDDSVGGVGNFNFSEGMATEADEDERLIEVRSATDAGHKRIESVDKACGLFSPEL